MVPNGNRSDLDARISFRAPKWLKEAAEKRAEDSPWANITQVQRDFVELGFLISHINSFDRPREDSLFDSPVFEWERPQGEYPDDEMLVCPRCATGSKYLFRYRNLYDVDAIQCLWCRHMDEADRFSHPIPENHYWARSGPHADQHIVNPDSRRTLCEIYNDSGLDTRFASDIDTRPTHICRGCWQELVGWDD